MRDGGSADKVSFRGSYYQGRLLAEKTVFIRFGVSYRFRQT